MIFQKFKVKKFGSKGPLHHIRCCVPNVEISGSYHADYKTT